MGLIFCAGDAAGGEAGQPPADDMDGIDPEFIAALPPDLQAEVLEQQRRDRRLRDAAVRREQAQQQVDWLPVDCLCTSYDLLPHENSKPDTPPSYAGGQTSI